MSSVACDKCGAQYEALPERANSETESPPSCPTCGSAGRWLTADVAERVPTFESVEPTAPGLFKSELDRAPESVDPITQRPQFVSSTNELDLLDESDQQEVTIALPDGELERQSGEKAPDSLIPLSLRDFVSDDERTRELPHAPVRARATSEERASEGEEAEPESVGTPTLATLVGHPLMRGSEAAHERRPTPTPPRRHPERDVQVISPTPIGPAPSAETLAPLRGPSEMPVAASTRPGPSPRARASFAFPALLLFAALGGAFYATSALQGARESEPGAQDAHPPAAAVAAASPLEANNAAAPQPASADSTLEQAPAPAPVDLGSIDADEVKPSKPAAASPEPKPVEVAPKSGAEHPATHSERAQNLVPQREPAPAKAEPEIASTKAAEPAVVAPPSEEETFDAKAAGIAIDRAAAQASSCRKSGDPSGVAVVTMTFSPSGRVTSANISGPPFAGTATGSCIASTLRTAKVPAYSGEYITVKKTLAIE